MLIFECHTKSQTYRVRLYHQLTFDILAHGLETQDSNDADGYTALEEKNQYNTSNSWEKCILGRLTGEITGIGRLNSIELSMGYIAQCCLCKRRPSMPLRTQC